MTLLPCYHVPEGDECLVITGGRAVKAAKSAEGGEVSEAPEVRIVKGKGVFVNPFTRKVRKFQYPLMEAEVEDFCPTSQGIEINVQAVINFRLDRSIPALEKSVPMFLRDNGEKLSNQAKKIFAGHLRSIVGTMTIKDIVSERQKLATEVLDASKLEMRQLGIVIESFQVEKFDDGDSRYLDMMRAPHLAAMERDAAIAKAQANQASAEAQQLSEQAINTARKETALLVAANKAETDKADQIALQSGPLQEAISQQDVLETQRVTAQKNAELVEARLQAEVIRPAEAARQQTEINAEALRRQRETQAQAEANAAAFAADGAARAQVFSAEGQRKVAEQNALAASERAKGTIAEGEANARKIEVEGQATAEAARLANEAAAAQGKVSIEKIIADQLPEIIGGLAAPFNGANMTYINDPNGVMNAMTGILALAPTVIEKVRAAMNTTITENKPEVKTNGRVEAYEQV